MRKSIAMILVFVLLAVVFATMPAFAADDGDAVPPLPAHIKDGVSVAAIFAAAEAQPVSGPKDAPADVEPMMLDTIWLYFSDNTFDQYAETPMGFELFSTGTYSFKEAGNFDLYEANDNGIIVIERAQKYSMEEKGLAEYASSHDYKLGSLGFSQLFGPVDGREVEAVFADDHSVAHKGEDGVISSLDAIWIYFSDGSFAEYAFLDGEIVPYGSGTYEFDDAGDFHIPPYEEEYGTISQTWTESLGGFAGETLTFDLSSMGFTCLYEKLDAGLSPELPVASGDAASYEEKVAALKASFKDFEAEHPEYEDAWHEIFESIDSITTQEFGKAFAAIQTELHERITAKQDELGVSQEDREQLADLYQSMAALINRDFKAAFGSAYDLNMFRGNAEGNAESAEPAAKASEDKDAEYTAVAEKYVAFVDAHDGMEEKIPEFFGEARELTRSELSKAFAASNEAVRASFEKIAEKYGFSEEDKAFVSDLLTSIFKNINSNFEDIIPASPYAANLPF